MELLLFPPNDELREVKRQDNIAAAYYNKLLCPVIRV